MTRVVFRKWKNGDIIALFPDEPWSRSSYMTTSYMHVGQHGAADYRHVIALTKPATEDEYHDLLTELKQVGYVNLNIVKRAKIYLYDNDTRQPL